MLYSLSKQIAHCYFRADECKELAAFSDSAADRQFYFEREQAWLALARGYEFQERLDQMVKELEGRGHLPPTKNVGTTLKLPHCPTCNVAMQFEAKRPAKRTFVENGMSFERTFFICPNCQRLTDQLVAMPQS